MRFADKYMDGTGEYNIKLMRIQETELSLNLRNIQILDGK